jgi:starch-binding outer membrane protein, SusD/RagB family
MRAEANLALGNRSAAITDINFIRTNSGGLAALPADFAGDLVTEILYNRRYSLFFEYGHRWVDLRRYNRLTELPKALPSHRVFPLVPIPTDECNQRNPAPRGCVQVTGF